MNLDYFKNKKITLFGLGLHGGGVGIVNFLVKYGARVIVTDIKSKEQLAPSLEKLKGLKNVEYVLGQQRSEDFSKVDMVIKNPIVSWDNQHIKLALENKIPVEMDSSLFFKLCKNPIIGITGTKGKTTTAMLIYEILKIAGKNPLKVGIGQASVLDKIDALKKDSVVVFELSSWRLSALGRATMSPHIAVITNILEDHLNFYKSTDDYVKDKKNIFLFQKPTDWLVINKQNDILEKISGEAKSKLFTFSLSGNGGNNSIYLDGEDICLNNGIDSKKIISLSDIKIPGKHNIQNVMAAIAACFAFGIKPEEIKKAIVNFKVIPHRLELVRELKNIKYYNDTAATIPDATISALDCFSQPIVLIAGGEDKGLDFSKLAQKILTSTKKTVFLKGSATNKLIEQIKKNLSEEEREKKTFEIFDSMEAAVIRASQLAESGDIVLLSPGAASFGLFLNEFDRGDKFKDAVGKLK
ncbi:MAG: UDP-N-acetylmuramoyl-L-alanine--D-glutamate ligase [bacterium]|nr:UDP-N-acetylmuramoyl-L-alanine--D-glutamate ligase [bacterium]